MRSSNAPNDGWEPSNVEDRQNLPLGIRMLAGFCSRKGKRNKTISTSVSTMKGMQQRETEEGIGEASLGMPDPIYTEP